MPGIYLVCATCADDAYPAPEMDDGTVVIAPHTLTIMQTSKGSRAVAICPSCADQLAGSEVIVSDTPAADEIPV